ncbi:MAG: protein kinase, partial [Myxococcota bacterium]|nr:protein kinase [Myxococcota bacterium]
MNERAGDGTEKYIFGKYALLKRLAVGGMGEIYLARQTGVMGFERLAILKALLPDLADDPDFRNQFLDEAKIAATLNHPNIVGIYEVGMWQDIYFLAMEYIEGESLQNILRNAAQNHLKIPHRVSAKIICDAADALHHAHTATSIGGDF